MGKGGGGDSPPEVSPIDPKESGGDDALLEQYRMQMQQMQQYIMGMSAQMSQMAQTPDLYTPPTVNWEERNQELNRQMSAEFHAEQMNKKGRTDTIHTSPLLDEDEAEITESLLVGKPK